LGNSYWSRQERGEDWLGESLRVGGTGFWVEVGNGPLVWGQAGRSTPAGGEGHRVRELGKVVSCGGSGEKGWRTELDLSRRKSLDDHHRAATVGTEPERSESRISRSACKLSSSSSLRVPVPVAAEVCFSLRTTKGHLLNESAIAESYTRFKRSERASAS
jgi:hypothetical protein